MLPTSYRSLCRQLQNRCAMSLRKVQAANGMYDNPIEDDQALVATTIPQLIQMDYEPDSDEAHIAIDILYEIASDDEIQQMLISPDTLKHLVGLLQRGKSLQIYQYAGALLRLFQNEHLRQLLVDAGAIPLLADVVWNGCEEEQILVAPALWNMAVDERFKAAVFSTKAVPMILRLLAKCRLHGEIDVLASIPIFVQLLREGDREMKEGAIGLLSCINSSQTAYALIIEAGIVPPLLDYLRDSSQSRMNALKLLGCLSTSSYDNKLTIVQAGAIGALIVVVRGGSPEEVSNAAYHLETILYPVNVSIPQISTTEIEALTELARERNQSVKSHCFKSLAYLARNPVNRRRIQSTDIILTVLDTLQEPFTPHRRNAVGLISNLSADAHGGTLISASGVIPVLVMMLGGSDSEESLKALYALTNFARHSQENRALLVAQGVFEPLVSIARSGSKGMKEVALFALILLSIKSNDIKRRIAAAGIIPELVGILRTEMKLYDMFRKFRALTLLKSLAVNDSNEKMVVAAGAIEPLASLVLDKDARLAWLAITTLQNLAVAAEHKTAIATSNGLVKSLLSRVRDIDEKLSMASLNVLTNIVIGCCDSKKAIVAKGGIADLAKVIRESDNKKRVQALWLLGELAIDPANKARIIASGVVSVLKGFAINGASEDVRNEAAAVLRAVT